MCVPLRINTQRDQRTTGQAIQCCLGKDYRIARTGAGTQEQRDARRRSIIYLEPTLERWEMLISSPEKDAQPKSAGTVEEIKADIVRLDAQGLYSKAIALAYKHNIGVEIQLPPVTI